MKGMPRDICRGIKRLGLQAVVFAREDLEMRKGGIGLVQFKPEEFPILNSIRLRMPGPLAVSTVSFIAR